MFDTDGYVNCVSPGLYQLCVDTLTADAKECKKIAKKMNKNKLGRNKDKPDKPPKAGKKEKKKTKSFCYNTTSCLDMDSSDLKAIKKCIKKNQKSIKKNAKLLASGKLENPNL